jgi:hypothetical protein
MMAFGSAKTAGRDIMDILIMAGIITEVNPRYIRPRIISHTKIARLLKEALLLKALIQEVQGLEAGQEALADKK